MSTLLLRATLLAIVIVLFSAAGAPARELGVGIVAGDLTGVSLKNRSGEGGPFDLTAGWSLSHQRNLEVRSNLFIRTHELSTSTQGAAQLYYGMGGGFSLQEDGVPRLSARFPIGSSYMFRFQRLEVFAEAAPVMCLFPKTDLLLGGVVGMRFYFGSR